MVLVRKYRRLTYQDRKTIERMLDERCGIPEIAEALGVHRSTIYCEFARCGTGKKDYKAEIGQKALKREPVKKNEEAG